MSSEKENNGVMKIKITEDGKITTKTALSIASFFKENIEEGYSGKKECLRLNINTLNLIKRIKSDLFKGIGSIIDIPDNINKETYEYHLFRLLDDALISISRIGHRKIKPNIKKGEDAYFYNTLKIFIYCYDSLSNTDKDFLSESPKDFYFAYKKIIDWIVCATKDQDLSKLGCGKLNSLLIFKRGINRHNDHNQLFYIFNYKKELHDFLIEHDIDDKNYRTLKKEYLMILHGATCSFNIKHMNHCLQILQNLISLNTFK